MSQSPRRLSGGGRAVQSSLEAAGFVQSSADVTLLETARPRLRPFSTVLAQNAWTMLTGGVFSQLIAPYPGWYRRRHVARRVVADFNLRRARTSVALTHAMADLMRTRGHNPVVSPVTVPWDLCSPSPAASRPSFMSDGKPFLLAPGTVTWYKGSHRLADLADLVGDRGDYRLVIAGEDDGTGCLEMLMRAMASADVVVTPVDRVTMTWLVRNTDLVLVTSTLESLSFTFAEAAIHARRVAATRLPVHCELAARLNSTTTWLNAGDLADQVKAALADSTGRRSDPTESDQAGWRSEWRALGNVLGLGRPA